MVPERSHRQSSAQAREPLNPALQSTMLEILETQLCEGTPPETRRTLERLIGAGYPDSGARRLIAYAVVSEIFAVMQRREPYDEARYIAARRRLPVLPEDR